MSDDDLEDDWLALSDPDIGTDEMEQVLLTLRSPRLSIGPVVERFEHVLRKLGVVFDMRNVLSRTHPDQQIVAAAEGLHLGVLDVRSLEALAHLVESEAGISGHRNDSLTPCCVWHAAHNNLIDEWMRSE